MYTKTDKDTVKKISEFPFPAAGATEPVVISSEQQMVLAYRVAESDKEWCAKNAVDLGGPEEADLWAIIHFKDVYASLWSPINDEGLGKHPLYGDGLTWYSVFEISQSSFCRALQYEPDQYFNRRHLIFTFQDSTFECIVGEAKVFLCTKGRQDIFQEMSRIYQESG